MQVSVSGVPDGVSLTIETHPLGQNKREQSVSSNSTENFQVNLKNKLINKKNSAKYYFWMLTIVFIIIE